MFEFPDLSRLSGFPEKATPDKECSVGYHEYKTDRQYYKE